MGRNNNDFSKGLFHGSSHAFEPKDIVNPGKDGVAWASTNPDVAQEYGEHLHEVEPLDDITRHSGAAKEFGIYYSKAGYRVTKRRKN